ncbi:BREX-3 system P-loop-containing protein BrxF [Longilinea arvoryzae]|uniref:BREX-3 system P-loop-containing protein BrxF n=1 Tax=Longilinea arvoryzae TaxID=360412 RepID=UPI0012601264|nr:BREX-3 system P-loop-containing protein BrxF [Longilinea arvoryzae]
MSNYSLESMLAQPYDCLVLVNPQVQILDEISEKIQSFGVMHLNVSKELGNALMTIPTNERGLFAEEWLKNLLRELKEKTVLCSHPDLFFHPSLKIDFFTLIRQVARIKQVIILWPGEYSKDTLTYAIPDHHHYEVWKISESLLIQPKISIYPISAAQGA